MIARQTIVHDGTKAKAGVFVARFDAPKCVFLPLEDAVNKTVELTVKEGDHVFLGQQIGTRKGAGTSSPVISTVSGIYLGNEKHLSRLGKPINFAKIENDGKDEKDPSLPAPLDLTKLNLFSLDVVRAYLDSVSLPSFAGNDVPFSKLIDYRDPVATILVNGMDAEPGCSSDTLLMAEHVDEIISGMALLRNILHCEDVRLCLPRSNESLKNSFESRMAALGIEDIQVVALGPSYANGWDIQLARKAAKVVLKKGETLDSRGVVVLNPASVYAFDYAIHHGVAPMQQFVTVGGDALASTRVCEVRIGTPLSDVLAALGGYAVDGKNVVLMANGLMMGANLPSDDLILTHEVKSFSAIVEQAYPEEVCVRCGSCVLACPAGLSPVTIANAMKVMPVNKERIKSLHPLDCCECGMCTYVCTSHIKLADLVRRAKVVAKL